MNELKNLIKSLSSEYFEEVRAIRRHLHQHPELSCQEFKTAEFICKKLDEYGISYIRGVAETGVVGIINGINPESKNVALRADMDALLVKEENAVEYKSLVPGKMHACGHDVHMASLLGAARILEHLKNKFEGSVKLIFQPSEESYPGGAVRMIREGVLKNPDTVSVIGQHVINTVDIGKIGLKAGPYMASTDEVFLTVKGIGGHAATPEQLVDPILIASHIIVALQQIVSRNANPIIPTVISFGRIIGDGRTNIIPDMVSVAGTVRTYDESWRRTIHEKITHMAAAIAEAMGGSCEVKISHGYPFLNNDEELTTKIRSWATDYLGAENVMELEARMTSEDFSYFANEVPSCFYRLGIRNEQKGIRSNLHTSTFDVDESCLATGMGLMAWLALSRLNELKHL
ncbi:MAG: M20 family metallopeptidase [Bacteroidetes bacterium]|nr:M20 family metallopeptidase [Bacteroidota bacterium]